MKSLKELNNVEMGKILHELFPNEIPDFLAFVKEMCATIKEDEDRQRNAWANGLYTFDFWFSLVNDAERRIIRYGNKLNKNSNLFSEQLFDGYLAIYLRHCLRLYTTVRQHPNKKFSLAVDLFFNA